MLVLPPVPENSLDSLEQLANYMAQAAVPALVEFESVWTIANRVCDQYSVSQMAA